MAKNNQTKLGKKIDERLKELRWSQRELARRTDISHSNISKIMRGIHRPTPETITIIGGALSLDSFYLMRLAGIPLPNNRKERDPAIEHIAQRLDMLSPDVKKPMIASIASQIDAIEAIEGVFISKHNDSSLDAGGEAEVLVEPIYEGDSPEVQEVKIIKIIEQFAKSNPSQFNMLRQILGDPPKIFELEFA